MKKILVLALLAGLSLTGCKEEKKADTPDTPPPVEEMHEESQEVNEMPSEEMNDGATESTEEMNEEPTESNEEMPEDTTESTEE